MSGHGLMQGLLVAYFVIACTFAYEANWPKMLYWVSAFGITFSVLWMGDK